MKEQKGNRCCNSQISINNPIFEANVNHTFCEKCGSIILKSHTGKIYYTLKNKQKKGPIEIDPIEIIKSMKNRTEKDYPFLNEEYNINKNNKSIKDKIDNSINLYLKHRDFIILNLQKLMDIFDYSDFIFYQCLFYLDIYLSHNMNEDISEKIILYYLATFFIISAKTKETDINEPNLDLLLNMKKDIYLTKKEINHYEVICLKTIKYNIHNYSVYDWISELSYIGFVFDCEINKENEKILINGHRHLTVNTIHKYIMKLLLNITVKNIFFKYSPMNIAFSLIQISREKFIDENHINNNLFNILINLFEVYFKDYKNCYEELKKELMEKDKNNDIIITTYNKQKNNKNINVLPFHNNLQNNSNKENNDNIKNLITYYKTNNEKFIEPKRIKSSNGLINLKEKFNLKMEGNNKTKTENIINSNEIIENKDEKFISNNSFKDETNNNSSKNKNKNDIINNNDNIILYDEKNEEKKHEIIIPKIDYLQTEIPIIRNKNSKENKMYSPANTNNKNIDCYRSHDDLPKINRFFDQRFSSQKKTKVSESKDNISITNNFLKSNLISLNLKNIKNRSLNITDKKKYLLNTTSNNCKKINNLKEKLNSVKKSLFCDNLNKNYTMEKTSINYYGIKNIKQSNLIPKISYFDYLINGKTFYKIKDKNVNNKRRNKSSFKEKAIDSVVWKETRLFIENKRNKSNKKAKRKNFKIFLYK